MSELDPKAPCARCDHPRVHGVHEVDHDFVPLNVPLNVPPDECARCGDTDPVHLSLLYTGAKCVRSPRLRVVKNT